MTWKVINGNNIDILKQYPDNHFDSIVTDPPYGIEFLGKDWDKNTGAIETWQECLRVLKPGGYLLAFSAARTYHHLATNIESVGFEIRDQLMWIYSSGFPKAQDIGKAIDKRLGAKREKIKVAARPESSGTFMNGSDDRPFMKKAREQGFHEIDSNIPVTEEAQQWAGWKTALKPAHEPIVMARKPFKGSTVDNVMKYGTGALNIDESRIPADDVFGGGAKASGGMFQQDNYEHDGFVTGDERGRFPSNVIGEIPEYQNFYYCPKVSRAERHIGFDKLPEPEKFNNPEDMKKHPLWEPSIGNNSHRLMKKIREHQDLQKNKRPRGEAFGDGNVLTDATQSTGNNHPTLKPVELMKYLIKLVTPKGGIVLDPFNGSGSTGMAAVELGYDYVGCELDSDYVEIANKRIAAWEKKFDTPAKKLFDIDD